MRKLFFLLYKDSLILLRDYAGLALLYVMPLVLVVLMAFLQNDTFKTILENKLPLLLLNQDADSVGNSMERSLRQLGVFSLVKAPRNTSPAFVEQAVARGDYRLGIVIPAHTTQNLRNSISQSIAHTFDAGQPLPKSQPVQIPIYMDPTAKNSFVSSLSSTLREHALQLQLQFLLKEVSLQVRSLSPMPIDDIQLPQQMVELKTQYARMDKSRLVPNAVQHNVPAWSLFAIFFIVVSLSSNIIRERNEGSFTRLRTLPFSYPLYLLSKVLTYLLICSTQFLLMGLVGKFVLPFLGLPALALGSCGLGLILVCLCSSLAAIGFGIVIGQVAHTAQQASVFGSISVVILSALGGIWIPEFVMPNAVRIICHFSPLNWGLNAFYNLLVRDGDLLSVLPQCGLLLSFGTACFLLAVWYDKRMRLDI